MEPAGGTPGWEAGVSAQTRGPGARREVQDQRKGDKWTGVGTGGEGAEGHRQYTVGVCLPALQSPAFQEEAELCWVKGREQRESHQQGKPRGRDQSPGASHALPRPAVQRTKEMLRTQATATGDLRVVRQCVWADQEGHSVVEIHSIATEMLSGGEGGVGAACDWRGGIPAAQAEQQLTAGL